MEEYFETKLTVAIEIFQARRLQTLGGFDSSCSRKKRAKEEGNVEHFDFINATGAKCIFLYVEITKTWSSEEQLRLQVYCIA
jgi:hypothetical protein